jgi:mono/diheme cytochrome c family protein
MRLVLPSQKRRINNNRPERDVPLPRSLSVPSGLALAALWHLSGGAVAAAEPDAVRRGEYVFYAGACDSCHTDHMNRGAFLAGGRAMDTPFGTFYVPNITPDPDTGLGGWSYEDFRRAMVEGRSPDGAHYYPVFPYRWYTGLTDGDLADLWAYLQSVPAVRNQTQPHDLPFPFNIRMLLLGWKLVNFDEGDTVEDPDQSPAWNRGAYIVNHLGHCGACHTPKILGMLFKPWDPLAGSEAIPGPYYAPNITPGRSGIGGWSEEDIARALKRSITPEGEPIRGPMAEYVASGSSHLTYDDLRAVAVYLKSLPPHDGPVTEEEERRDRRLVSESEGQRGGGVGSGGGGIGSAGMGLLRVGAGGRADAK